VAIKKFFSFKFVVLLLFISGAMFAILYFPEHIRAAPSILDPPDSFEPAFKVLKDTNSGMGKYIKEVSSNLLNVINGFAIILLIVVALSEILRFNISTYGIKKILPTLILALVAANFSFLFIRLLVDFANVVMGAMIDKDLKSGDLIGIFGNGDWASAKNMGVADAVDKGQWGTIFWFIIAQFLVFGAGILTIILSFLFFIRLWVIYFLTALAPLAFMSMVLPQTKNLFSTWWSNLFKWVFMPVISIFWIWLGAQWVNVIHVNSTGGTPFFLSFLFTGVCFYMAITTPFKLGGAIMNQWGKLPKTLGNYGLKKQGDLAAGMSWWGQNMQKTNAKGSFRNRLGGMMEKVGGATNINATRQALQARNKAFGEGLRKAEVKTGTYGRFGGVPVRFEGAKARNEDTLKYMPPQVTGEKMRSIEERMMAEYGRGKQGRLLETDIQKIMKANGWEGALDDDQHRKAALRQILATDGPNNLYLKYRGFTDDFKDENAIIMTEGITRNFNKDAKGQRTSRDLTTGYGAPVRFASSPVGQAVEQRSENISTRVRTALPGQADDIIRAAAYSNINFENIVKENKTLAEMSPEARKGITDVMRESFEQIRASRDDAVKEMMEEGKTNIERELNGVKMVLGGRLQHGYQREQLKSNLDTALKLAEAGDIDSIIKPTKEKFGDDQNAKIVSSLISTAAIGENKEEKLDNIKKRLDTLQAGLQHFDRIANIKDPKERTAAIAHANSLIQAGGPKKYTDEAEAHLNRQNEFTARATVASQMAVGSIASNPALAGMSLGQLASNEHAIEEMAHSMQGLTQSMHELSQGPLGEFRSASVGAQADVDAFKDAAKDTIKSAMQGVFSQGVTAQDPLSNPRTRQLLGDQLAKSMAQTLRKNPLQVKISTPKPPTTQTTQTSTQPPTTEPAPKPKPPLAQPPKV